MLLYVAFCKHSKSQITKNKHVVIQIRILTRRQWWFKLVCLWILHFRCCLL